MSYICSMFKNLISILVLCADNPINVLFFDSFFQVQDRHTGSPWFAGSIETVSIIGRS